MVSSGSNGGNWRDGLATLGRHWRAILTYTCGITLAVCLAIVAIQLYKAAEQQNPGYSYQPADEASGATVGATKTPTKVYQPRCKNPQSNGDADLCAQWAAVEQVVEANRLSSLNAKMGIASLIATAIATFLLLWTLQETRSTARRQLRAYLDFNGVNLVRKQSADTDPDVMIGIAINVKNFGQTPAYDVILQKSYWVEKKDGGWFHAEIVSEDPADDIGCVACNDDANFVSLFAIPRKLWELISDGKTRLKVKALVNYVDAFGKSQSIAGDYISSGNVNELLNVANGTRKHT